MSEVAASLGPWRRRYWLRQGVWWTLIGLAAGLGAAIVVLLAARLTPWADARPWAVGVAVAGPLAGLAYAIARRPSLSGTANRVDRLLGLADRQATAWELRDTRSVIADLQRRDALSSLRARSVSAVSLWPGRRPSVVAATAAGAVALLAVLPNPMDRVLAERQEFQEEIADAREELEKAKEQLAESASRLSPEEREALEEALSELEERLAKASDKPEALAALSDAERTLQQLRQPGESQAQQEMITALAAMPGGAALAEALQSGDSQALANAMEALAEQLASLSPEERAELMTALQQAANATAGIEGLPGALRDAAAALASGDTGAMSAALGDLEDLLAALQEGAAVDEAIAAMLSDIGAARASISGLAAAPTGATSSGQGSGNGEGTGEGSGEGGTGSGEGEGSGSGSGSGEGAGSGNGTGTGSGAGGSGTGAGGGEGGSGAGNAPGVRQGDHTDRLGAGGETVFIPSQGEGGLRSTQTGTGAGTVPGDLRPYQEVIGQYASQARAHMDRSAVPEGYRDLVRQYFSELEQ